MTLDRDADYAQAVQHVNLELLKRFGSLTLVPVAKRKNPAAVALGRRGGKKSGQARMEKLTSEQRTVIARNAAQARWRKERDTERP